MTKTVKCLVWDLDGTLWDGTLLEDEDNIRLRFEVTNVVRGLDERGILQSIASRNDYDSAVKKLKELGLEEYFLYPQITWGAKSESIRAIAKELGIGLDSIAFMDDSPAELHEVSLSCPEVRCYDARDYNTLLSLPEFTPEFLTEDSKSRRSMYRSDMLRRHEERDYAGTNEEFLKTLDMELTISPVRDGDLERVEELTLRTNQLNSTGLTFDMDELKGFIGSKNHVFLIAGLRDRFGTYGKIGLVLAEETDSAFTVKLLIMSCRVMTRGVGSALLVCLTQLAAEKGKALLADFVDTGKNRVMYVTYKLLGFEEDDRDGDASKLCYSGGAKSLPGYLKVIFE